LLARGARSPSGLGTLVGVGLSGVTGLAGGVLGVLLLSGWNRRVDWVAWILHPDLMVFGFLTLFTVAVATSLVPKLNSTRANPKLGLTSIGLLASTTPLWLLFHTRPLMGDIALLASAIVFAAYTLSSVKRPRNAISYGNIYFGAGALTLIAVATIKTLVDAQSPYGEWDEYTYTWLALMGFPTSTILGVWQHTAHFRGVSPRKTLSAAIAILWCTTLAIYTSSAITTLHVMRLVGVVIEVIALSTFLFNLSAFTPAQLPSRWAFDPNKWRYRWFDRSIRIASLWLTVGIALQALYAVCPEGFTAGYTQLLDAWIHTISLGFYLVVIASYAPIILPVLLRGRTLNIRLTLIPQLLVSLSVAWRILADLLTVFLGSHTAALLEYSPLPAFLAILVFLVDVHRVRGGRRSDTESPEHLLYLASNHGEWVSSPNNHTSRDKDC